MPYRAPEETMPRLSLTIFAIIAIGAWLSYRHYAAAVERSKRREEIPFGELRVIQEGEDPKFEIIAVQGLGSHPERTWKSKEQNDEAADDMEQYPDLLKHLLPAHFKNARITQWVYNSDWDHDGSPSKSTNYTSYHFLHLTYQEYFAAQYFVKQWQENRRLVVLSKDGLGTFSNAEANVEEFLVKNKYLPTLYVFWRFVCGLLPEHHQVEFFRLVGQNPDILGPTHQRLIMHCLAEASLTLPVRDQLENELTKWAYFELSGSDQSKYSRLLAEAEFPESAVDRILSNRSFRLRGIYLEALSQRNCLSSLSLSEIFIRTVIENEKDLLHSGKSLLAASNLPKSLVDQILERTADENTGIALDCLEILMSQQQSPVPPETIERYAQSPDPTVGSKLISILHFCKYIPDVILSHLPSWRQADNQNLRLAAISLQIKSNSPGVKILEEISMPREDDEIEVRYALIQLFILIERSACTPKMLEFAVRNSLMLEMQTETPDYHQSTRNDLIDHHRGALGPVYTTLLRSCPPNEQLRLLEDLKWFDLVSSDVISEVVRLMESDYVEICLRAFWIIATEESLDQDSLAAMRHNLEHSLQQTETESLSAYHQSFKSRRKLSTNFILSLRPLVQDTSHPLHDRSIQVLNGEIRIMDGTLERLIPPFGNPLTIDRDLLKLCHRLNYLPEELEQSLVNLLAHSDESIQLDSGQILGNQSSLRLTSLGAIVTHLRGKSETARLAAFKAVKGLRPLPNQISEVFCDLLQQHEETRLPICQLLYRLGLEEGSLHENLSKALVELIEDGDSEVRFHVFRLFRCYQKRTVPMSTIKLVLSKFRQFHGVDNQSLRISMAEAMGGHISDTELAPIFIQILCKDTAEVQIAFLQSFDSSYRVRTFPNHIGEELLPLFDTYYDDVRRPLDVHRALVKTMWLAGEKTTTRKISIRMIQLLYHDDPSIKVAAGNILARHESDEYLHIFARLLGDSASSVRVMAYNALIHLSNSFKLPAECLDVLRGLLDDKSIHVELKKKVFEILRVTIFDYRTKPARDLLDVVLPFLESETLFEDTISVLSKFDDLSGQNMGYIMFQLPSVQLQSKVFQLFLSRCNTEELQTLLNDLDKTIQLYRTALSSSWNKAISIHFINESDIQINTSTGVKIIKMQNPKRFLATIQKYRQRSCRMSGIEPPLSIKKANLSSNCEDETISNKGKMITI
ncbi:hypothetical protein FSHL1_006431 [Fusarium sambucinum]